MRLLAASLIASAVMILAYSPACAEDFTLKATTVEALEDGPLVVRVTLDYRGEKRLRIRTHNWSPNAFAMPREKWERRGAGGGVSGSPYGSSTLSPGDKRTEILYVHQHFQHIPRGKTVFEVVWPIHEPGLGGKEIARPVTTLEVDIPAANKERTRVLCQWLEEKLNNGKETVDPQQSIRKVIDYIRYTNHAELAPIAWRLMEFHPESYPASDFIEMIYATAEDKRAVNRRLAKLACDPNYPHLDNIFWYWLREKITLSSEELAPLLRSENVWIRALTYLAFPSQRTQEWTDRLFRDLRDAQQPLPEVRFAQLLTHLDDDDFIVRERATCELQQYGDPVRAQLLKVLQGQPTPEVKARVKSILGELDKGPPRIVRTTLWLADNHPDAKAFLRLLAEGEPNSWATREAKAILMRR